MLTKAEKILGKSCNHCHPPPLLLYLLPSPQNGHKVFTVEHFVDPEIWNSLKWDTWITWIRNHLISHYLKRCFQCQVMPFLKLLGPPPTPPPCWLPAGAGGWTVACGGGGGVDHLGPRISQLCACLFSPVFVSLVVRLCTTVSICIYCLSSWGNLGGRRL